ncbi:MAG: zinc carboxypeptidase, partial [Chitinophagaceae bacterium]|nr:zinc carboxypeptidase [Chitinophagaceae bacterium]
AYASREKISSSGSVQKNKVINEETSYGYVIPWHGIKTVNLVCQLLKKGILLRYAEQPFEVNGNKFERGAIIILRTANKAFGNTLWTNVREAANAMNIKLYPVSTGFVDKGFDFGSDKVHPFKAPKVALLTGEGINSNAAGEIWHFFDHQLNYPLTLINATEVAGADWHEIDVLIMPDGNYQFLSDKAQAEAFKNWISNGGRVIALESAVAALSRADFGIKVKKAEDSDKKDDKAGYEALRKFEERDRDYLRNITPGSIFRVELDNTHPLAYGYPAFYHTLKMDGNVYEFMKEDGWNVGTIRKDNQVAGYVGERLKDRLKDGLVFGVQQIGGGSVTYLTDNVLFRSFWENGKLLLCNAVFLVGQ